VTEKFEFIDAEYAAYREPGDIYVPSIVKMCRWMKVSRSFFYEWRNAPESATAKSHAELALIITKSFDESNETYGYRRLHADLAAWGVPCGPELVRSVMRELGPEACQPKPWRFSLTEGDGQEHDIPDLVNRDFTASAPGEKIVGDITYISTWQGWVYLATVIDCYTKAVVGWAIDDNYKTPLIERAIEMVRRDRRTPGDRPESGVYPPGGCRVNPAMGVSGRASRRRGDRLSAVEHRVSGPGQHSKADRSHHYCRVHADYACGSRRMRLPRPP
jgi:putative transposase